MKNLNKLIPKKRISMNLISKNLFKSQSLFNCFSQQRSFSAIPDVVCNFDETQQQVNNKSKKKNQNKSNQIKQIKLSYFGK